MKKNIIKEVTKKELKKLYLIKEDNFFSDALEYVKNKFSSSDKSTDDDEGVFDKVSGKVKDTLKDIFGDEEFMEETRKSSFIKNITSMVSSGKTFKYGVSGRDVEQIQVALQILEFLPENLGINGVYDKNTQKAVKEFQKSIRSNETGNLTSEDLENLKSLLILRKFKDSDLSKIQRFSDFSKINVGNDKEFYEAILKGIGAPITEENMKFLYSWRRSEGARATNNPFNTTLNLKKDEDRSNYNYVGVKNYSTPGYGIEATIKTLLNGRYKCIVDGLRQDIGAIEISECQSLHTWGTGDLVNTVLTKYGDSNIKPPPIYRY